MPLRPIDAIFVHPEQRLYVVYYRGELWQLPRMKIDDAAWQRRLPFKGNKNELYLSQEQAIHDLVLAQKLRTLNLPIAVRGSTLAKFEAWWEFYGFKWLKDLLDDGKSPLAAHASLSENKAIQQTTPVNKMSVNKSKPDPTEQILSSTETTIVEINNKNDDTDIFADMLADLADEVLNQRH